METTLTLRTRLGFDDTVLWKQFCAKRLHLIHTLSLNSRKASEQEEQVRSIASDLCAEYGFSTNAQADFEKLIIAGIQSVRRNQKRLQRHAPTPTAPEQHPSAPAPQPTGGQQQSPPTYGFIAHAVPAGAYSLPQHMLPGLGSASSPVGGIHHPQVGAAHLTAAHMVHQSVQSPYILAQQQPPPPPPPPPATHAAQLPPGPAQAPPTHHLHTHSSSSHMAPGALAGKLEVLRLLLAPYLALGSTQTAAARCGASQIAAEGLLSAAIAAAATHVGSSPSQMQAMHVALLAGTLRDAFARAVGAANSRLFIEATGALAASSQGPTLLAALQDVLFELAMASQDVAGMLRLLLAHFAPSPRVGHAVTSLPSGSATPVHNARPSPPQLSMTPPASASRYSSVGPSGEQLPHTQEPRAQEPSHKASTQASTLNSDTPATPVTTAQPGAQRGSQPGSQPPFSAPQSSLASAAPSAPPSAPHTAPAHPSPQTAHAVPPLNSLPVQAHSPPASAHSLSQQPLVSHDRLVTLKYDSRELRLTYSPLKATPPALTEIIENARQTFEIGAERVVRVKDMQRGKIVETNAELIDAFSQPTVTLEILLPPPMLHDASSHARGIGFASLAPILQPSLK